MEQFRPDVSALPLRFWRVKHSTSTRYTGADGFTARDPDTEHTTDIKGLREAVRRALTWVSRFPSPFIAVIAVIADNACAQSWAQAYTDYTINLTQFVEIDTSKLQGILVVKLSNLISDLSIMLTEGAVQQMDDIYFRVRKILTQAIVSVAGPSEGKLAVGKFPVAALRSENDESSLHHDLAALFAKLQWKDQDYN